MHGFMSSLRHTFALASCVLTLAGEALADGAEGDRLFREKIEPVLVRQCYRCHASSAEKIKGGLLLDSRDGLRTGGDSGPAVVPGKSDESLLVQAIRHDDGMAMPPKSPRLDEAIIADFVAWIDRGAPDPRTGLATPNGPPSIADARGHWAFQSVRRIPPPAVQDASWAKNPVDAFILSRLEERRWAPAPPASRAEWIRRVTFDLTGLPPSPEEIKAYEQDPSLDADERLVDRLLESPQYGERWAQHWLDVVRFAETEGYEYDRNIPDAWRFRDYVVASLNHDKPFDRFVAEQVAGDEIGPKDAECLTASTFHRLGPVRRNAGNPEIALSRNEVLTERTDIIGTAFLGLTIGCARCHNHKLEPILQKDYYRLQAYLAATDEANLVLATEAERKQWATDTARLNAQIEPLRKKARRATGQEKDRLTNEIEALEDELPPPLATIPGTSNDFAHRTEIHVLKRGVWENKAEPVGPRPPSVLVPDDQPELPADVSNPRTQLARWMTAPGHPLTARVIANRIWQHHFGLGLVKSVNDFGIRGDRPSHPELLDWLASELVQGGWRLKPLHRRIVLSSTYRQSTRGAPDVERSDPENRLLAHFSRRRLAAEEVRDAMLAVSGRLNLKAGGPSVMVPVDPELTKLLYKPSQWQVARDPSEFDRRTLYLLAKRNMRLPFLETFDAPALLTSCPRRESSTHAPQALELLNGRLANDLASAFASRLERECGDSQGMIVDRAFRLAIGRGPTGSERDLSLAFLRDQPLKEFALATFNLNGFLYVP
jgi:hypothetical protein